MDVTPEQAWKQLNEKNRQRFNHPEGSRCPVCNGSGRVMTVWSDAEYYHGLLTVCPECGAVHSKDEAARKAGNAPRYGDYIDLTEWQRTLHRRAGEFAPAPSRRVLHRRPDRHRQEPPVQQDLLSPDGKRFQRSMLSAVESIFPAQFQGLATDRDGQGLQRAVV